jgi:hypothetical protein
MWRSVSEVFGVSHRVQWGDGEGGAGSCEEREMLNLRGKCRILLSSWSGDLFGSCCSGAPTLRQIILK